MNLIEYPDRDLMMIDVANQLASELNAAVLVNDHASFAVPGGSTPGPIFDVLCAADVHWSKISVMLTDERWVPETSDQSNARLIKQRLLVERAAEASFIPFYRDGATPEDCIPELSERLAQYLPLSVLVLGMGADMHTASLFPGAAGLEHALNTTEHSFFATSVSGVATSQRISLTGQVLNGAMSKHLLITGAEKRAAVEYAQIVGDPMIAPVAAILSGTTVHWAE